MRSAIVGASAGVVLGLSCLPGCVAQPRFEGPLPVRNQHPAQLLVQHMPPASAAVLSAGGTRLRADAAYSSLFLDGSRGASSFRMDGEYLRVAPGASVGLGGGFELSGEVPFAHTTGGFLDDFVIDYHDTFGFPDQNREENPRDAYEITARRNGVVAWSVDRADLELMDVPLHLTWQMTEPGDGRLGAALRAGCELPTGDDDRGYGNGEVDASLGALLEYHVLGIAWYGHAQHTFAGTPDRSRRVGLDFADVTSVGGAAELPLGEDVHAFVQLEWETSTLRELGFPTVARDQLLLWVGLRVAVGDAAVELGFGEDLQGLVSPDFTAWLGVVWRPGARR